MNFPAHLKKPPTHVSGCTTCSTDIVVSCYFDRFGFDEKSTRTSGASNVGKLFRMLSLPTVKKADIRKDLGLDRTTLHFSHYVPGLGTPFKPGSFIKTGAALVIEAVADLPKEAAKDKGKEVAKDSFNKGVSQMLKEQTGLSATAWRANWERMYKQGSKALAKSGLSAKQTATTARLALKHTGDVAGGVSKMGLSVGSEIAKAAAKAALLAVVEDTEASDTTAIAKLMRTGHKKRLEDAWEFVRQTIEDNQADIKPPGKIEVGNVRIYIFGAEWGGTLARMFANKIANKCEKVGNKLMYKGIEVQIPFVGLFDCANSSSGNKLVQMAFDYTPVLGTLDDVDLPKYVGAALHIYGAHERGYMYASLDKSEAQAKYECALPGIASDVCGGKLLKHETGMAHLEIAKVSLCQMHAIARSYGAPFAHPDSPGPEAQNFARLMKPDFLLNGKDIHEHMAHYLHMTDTATAGPEEALRASREWFVKWMRSLYDGSNHGKDLSVAVAQGGEQAKSFLEDLRTMVTSLERESKRAAQLVPSAMEYQLAQLWASKEQLDDPYVGAFLLSFTHFRRSQYPLTFRQIA